MALSGIWKLGYMGFEACFAMAVVVSFQWNTGVTDSADDSLI